MTDTSQNPDNANQYRVFFELIDAFHAGVIEHPQVVMERLSKKLDFTILVAEPMTMFDGWSYWIEAKTKPVFPSYIHDVNWRPFE